MPFRKQFKALRVETSFYKQRNRRLPFRLPPHDGSVGMLIKRCNMQPTTLRTAQRSFTLKDWASEKRNKFSQWFNGESATFSRLCGERFTHKEVVYAHLFLVILLTACFVAEWLEGGAL